MHLSVLSKYQPPAVPKSLQSDLRASQRAGPCRPCAGQLRDVRTPKPTCMQRGTTTVPGPGGTTQEKGRPEGGQRIRLRLSRGKNRSKESECPLLDGEEICPTWQRWCGRDYTHFGNKLAPRAAVSEPGQGRCCWAQSLGRHVVGGRDRHVDELGVSEAETRGFVQCNFPLRPGSPPCARPNPAAGSHRGRRALAMWLCRCILDFPSSEPIHAAAGGRAAQGCGSEGEVCGHVRPRKPGAWIPSSEDLSGDLSTRAGDLAQGAPSVNGLAIQVNPHLLLLLADGVCRGPLGAGGEMLHLASRRSGRVPGET